MGAESRAVVAWRGGCGERLLSGPGVAVVQEEGVEGMEWGLGTPTRDPVLTLVTVCISCACCPCRENQQCEEMVVSECHCAHIIRSPRHIPSVYTFFILKSPTVLYTCGCQGAGG